MRKFLKSRDDAMYFCESVEVDSFFLAFLWKFRYNAHICGEMAVSEMAVSDVEMQYH